MKARQASRLIQPAKGFDNDLRPFSLPEAADENEPDGVAQRVRWARHEHLVVNPQVHRLHDLGRKAGIQVEIADKVRHGHNAVQSRAIGDSPLHKLPHGFHSPAVWRGPGPHGEPPVNQIEEQPLVRNLSHHRAGRVANSQKRRRRDHIQIVGHYQVRLEPLDDLSHIAVGHRVEHMVPEKLDG